MTRGLGKCFLLEAPGLKDPLHTRGYIRGSKAYGKKMEEFEKGGGQEISYASNAKLEGKSWSKTSKSKAVVIWGLFDSQQNPPSAAIRDKNNVVSLLDTREKESWTIAELGDDRGPWGMFRRSDVIKIMGKAATDDAFSEYREETKLQDISHPKDLADRKALITAGLAATGVSKNWKDIKLKERQMYTTIGTGLMSAQGGETPQQTHHPEEPSRRREATDEGYETEDGRVGDKGSGKGGDKRRYERSRERGDDRRERSRERDERGDRRERSRERDERGDRRERSRERDERGDRRERSRERDERGDRRERSRERGERSRERNERGDRRERSRERGERSRETNETGDRRERSRERRGDRQDRETTGEHTTLGQRQGMRELMKKWQLILTR